MEGLQCVCSLWNCPVLFHTSWQGWRFMNHHPSTLVLQSILSHGWSPLVLVQTRLSSRGSVCTSPSSLPTTSLPSAHTALCRSRGDEHHVFVVLCVTLCHPIVWVFGCVADTEQPVHVYICLPLLLRSTMNSTRTVCLCLSWAIATLNGFCGSFFSHAA